MPPAVQMSEEEKTRRRTAKLQDLQTKVIAKLPFSAAQKKKFLKQMEEVPDGVLEAKVEDGVVNVGLIEAKTIQLRSIMTVMDIMKKDIPGKLGPLHDLYKVKSEIINAIVDKIALRLPKVKKMLEEQESFTLKLAGKIRNSRDEFVMYVSMNFLETGGYAAKDVSELLALVSKKVNMLKSFKKTGNKAANGTDLVMQMYSTLDEIATTIQEKIKPMLERKREIESKGKSRKPEISDKPEGSGPIYDVDLQDDDIKLKDSISVNSEAAVAETEQAVGTDKDMTFEDQKLEREIQSALQSVEQSLNKFDEQTNTLTALLQDLDKDVDAESASLKKLATS